ncbi:MAG: histidine ammonia-lyase [Planctomycetota bacterium]|jgi:histidine ammonia-lyase
MERIRVDGRSLSPAEVRSLLRGEVSGGELCAEARSRVEASRAVIDEAVATGRTVYGVNTGFGKLADRKIPPERVRELQRNLLRSHACGVGDPLPDDDVALALLFRANALAVGRSGVRPILIETLLEMLEKGVRPVVPEKGSVGASGDLAPLAHLALPLMGEGRARHGGVEMTGEEAMAAAGIPTLTLEAKEGLALINGVQISSAIGARALDLGDVLLRTADLAAATSLEALFGSVVPFDPRIHEARPHPGQIETAANVRRVLEESEVIPAHAGPHKVQDAYSLRCVPQVHGAARDALRHTLAVLYREVNSATDNPLIFAEEGDVLPGGNFHGEPVALALDHATLALHELGSISERRIESIVNPTLSEGLPPFLAAEGGLQSGFMMAQVTAAALVCETRTLCSPAAAESIPTSANQEDHVSLAPLAARRAAQVAREVATILGIEILAACRGLDFRKPLRPGKGVAAVYDLVRERLPERDDDRPLSPEIETVRDLVLDGALVDAAESEAGALAGLL